jgi:hypothetical protein
MLDQVKGWLPGPDMMTTLLEGRLALEIVALCLVSALIGFLTARSMYRGQVEKRTEVLRSASASWRRRLSQSQRQQLEASMQRARASRQLRKTARTGAGDGPSPA